MKKLSAFTNQVKKIISNKSTKEIEQFCVLSMFTQMSYLYNYKGAIYDPEFFYLLKSWKNDVIIYELLKSLKDNKSFIESLSWFFGVVIEFDYDEIHLFLID